jgi:outer membrane lipase/esterase
MAPISSRRSIAPLIAGIATGIAAATPLSCYAIDHPAPTDDGVAIDTLVPSTLIEAANTALDLAALENQSVLRRLAALRGGSHGVDFANLTVQVGDQHLAADSVNAVSKPIVGSIVDGVLSNAGVADRFGVFTNGAVRVGRTVFDAKADDAIDLTSGVDYRLRDDLAVGASGGYSRDPSGSLDLTTWRSSLYGTYFTRDRFHVDALLSYGTVAINSTRAVETAANPTTAAKANADGRQLSGVLSGAFDWRYGAWAFGPHAGAYYLDADVSRLDETGAGTYDINVGNQSAQSLRMNAGAQIGVALRTPWGVLTPTFDADYVHDLADRDQTVDVSLASLTDNSNSIDAALHPLRTDPGYFVWSVGASTQWMKSLSTFVSYRTYAGADAPTLKELTWGVRVKVAP